MDNINQTTKVAKTKLPIANLVTGPGVVLPKPPIPTKVLRSAVPPPSPHLKVSSKVEVEVKEEVKKVKLLEPETEPKCVITIKTYNYKPFEVEFKGTLTGSDRDLAWRAMMKQYKVWKAKQAIG